MVKTGFYAVATRKEAGMSGDTHTHARVRTTARTRKA